MIDKNTQQNDPIAVALRSYAQHILVVIFGLLPLIFIPTSIAPFEYTKALVVLFGILAALVLYSLSVLRSGVVNIGVSYSLCALWAVVGIAFISTLFSGDFKDSLVGDLFSIHSTVFVAVLALIPTVWVLLKPSKATVMKLYILLAVSTIVLVVFHIARLFFGVDFLSFGVFTNTVSTPVGSWNDLALFLGLTVVLSLVAIEQLSLTKVGKILFAVVILLALLMLGVINFFMVWIILGLMSLIMVVYSLGKDRFEDTQLPLLQLQSTNTKSLTMALVVLTVSVVFVVGGSTVGGFIAEYTNVSYVEVRPSLEATANIARNVYHENAFLGIGTNRFADAWRLYKEVSINSTPFWNTEFNSGNGYVTTFFVTTGVLGGIAWLLFLGVYLVTGVRNLLGITGGDKMWYFIGVSSFVSAVYIWGMSLVYVPGVVILLLGALCTGVSLSAFNALHGNEGRLVFVGTNRRTGFALTMVVITVIIGSISVLYVAGRHYTSVYTFNKSVQSMQSGKNIEEIEREVAGAFQLSSSDIFARRIAEYQFARLNSLVAVAQPTEVQQKEFQSASVIGVNAAQQAIQIDGLEPANYEILGNIYSVLASVGVAEAKDRALEAFAKARELNPKNPLLYLESAIVEGRSGNVEGARENITNALNLKPDFTEAFFLLSQLEIATGNVEAAIATTHAIINLEPKNPARHYQLGVLESSRDNLDVAISAFEEAIRLDESYANARYLLALAYDIKGRSEDAKKQLEVVLSLNPDNQEVANLISVIEKDGSLKNLRAGTSQTVQEAIAVTDDNGTVSTTRESDTPLVTPVNTAPTIPSGDQ